MVSVLCARSRVPNAHQGLEPRRLSGPQPLFMASLRGSTRCLGRNITLYHCVNTSAKQPAGVCNNAMIDQVRENDAVELFYRG